MLQCICAGISSHFLLQLEVVYGRLESYSNAFSVWFNKFYERFIQSVWIISRIISHNNGQAARHGLLYGHWESFTLRGQYENVTHSKHIWCVFATNSSEKVLVISRVTIGSVASRED